MEQKIPSIHVPISVELMRKLKQRAILERRKPGALARIIIEDFLEKGGENGK